MLPVIVFVWCSVFGLCENVIKGIGGVSGAVGDLYR